MKKIILPLFLLGIGLLSACKAAQVQKSVSGDQIEQLKSGMLLVRLTTGIQKIEKLKASGQQERAYQEEKNIKTQNERILKAFQEYYDFSKVYFFDSDQAEEIRKGNLNGILKDVSGQNKVSSAKDSVFFLIASFSQLQEPAGSAGIPALIIMDKNYKQLEKPFPFSVRTALYGEENKADKAVQLLNIQLHEYYLQSMKWRKKQEFKKAKRQFMEENRY